MIATISKTIARKERPSGDREGGTARTRQATTHTAIHVPSAGAHAATHLINEDATPGAGALPSSSHASGKDVDGGAG